jgi:hypothetical protein
VNSADPVDDARFAVDEAQRNLDNARERRDDAQVPVQRERALRRLGMTGFILGVLFIFGAAFVGVLDGLVIAVGVLSPLPEVLGTFGVMSLFGGGFTYSYGRFSDDSVRHVRRLREEEARVNACTNVLLTAYTRLSLAESKVKE